jgi:hypothetical protein
MTTLEEAARDALELCERIIKGKRIWSLSDMRVVSAVLREALEQAEPVVDGNTSDGYHTFNELYDFRMSYNAALFNEWAESGKHFVHKSRRHHDGELCFGGGYFVVVAVLPEGQISNHYKVKYWNLFNIVSVEKALFEFDGHTGSDVLSRLKSYRPQQAEPVVERVAESVRDLAHEKEMRELQQRQVASDCADDSGNPSF